MCTASDKLSWLKRYGGRRTNWGQRTTERHFQQNAKASEQRIQELALLPCEQLAEPRHLAGKAHRRARGQLGNGTDGAAIVVVEEVAARVAGGKAENRRDLVQLLPGVGIAKRRAVGQPAVPVRVRIIAAAKHVQVAERGLWLGFVTMFGGGTGKQGRVSVSGGERGLCLGLRGEVPEIFVR